VNNPLAKTAIVIVNWNGWRDTLECLESLLRMDSPDYTVIVCDNGSSDGSLERIAAWARGAEPYLPPDGGPLAALTVPPVVKPVSCRLYQRGAAESGGDVQDDPRLVLIQNGANLGFAGGNNTGLRYALRRGGFDYCWLLNNDTVVKPDTLACLINRLRERPGAGLCGSTLLYHDQPERVQALGGAAYNKWFGLSRHIGEGQAVATCKMVEPTVEARLDYIMGASMLATREFLLQVGLLNEEYFLFYEEIDWALRAKGRFQLAYASRSIVYHKGGRSTGSGPQSPSRSETAEYYALQSRLRFTREHYPLCSGTVLLWIGLSFIRYLLCFKWKSARRLARAFKNQLGIRN
jgi:GT2 family glycosyltransferase